LLPIKENITKSDSKLISIDNQWLKDQILKYAFIPEDKYLEFSNLINLDNLKEYRRKFFEETFNDHRSNLFY
jgi:hypothetical protein